MNDQRIRVLALYKKLLYMGREYPKGYDYFKQRCYKVFDKNRHLTDRQAIEDGIKRGEYVCRELEALWMLRKYRWMKRSYYDRY